MSEQPNAIPLAKMSDVSACRMPPIVDGSSARAALEAIAASHVPDQPASSSMTEADYVRRHVASLRRIALDALSGASDELDLDQILRDPENQPSQFGTVPVEFLDVQDRRIWVLEEALRRTRMTLLIAGATEHSKTVSRISNALATTPAEAI